MWADCKIELCRDYDDKLLSSLTGLMKIAFPNCQFGESYYKWQYMQNPNGKVISYNAYSKDRVMVAHYAVIPIKMRFGDKTEIGVLSLNTATHPQYRGKGLFTILANKTYDYAKEHGYKFVIGVSNANSTYGFLNKLGFYLVSPLSVKIGIGNPYKKFEVKDKIRSFYDLRVLNWRLSCPEFSYSLDSNLIMGSINKPLFKTCVAPVPIEIDIEKLKLKHKRILFGLYIGLGIKTSGFYIKLPKIIKRSPFNLIFRDLTDGELPVLTESNTFFTLLDYDVA